MSLFDPRLCIAALHLISVTNKFQKSPLKQKGAMSQAHPITNFPLLRQRGGEIAKGYDAICNKQRQCVTALEYANFLHTVFYMVAEKFNAGDGRKELKSRFAARFDDFVNVMIAESNRVYRKIATAYPGTPEDQLLAASFFLVLTAQPLGDTSAFQPAAIPSQFRNMDLYLFDDSEDAPRDTLKLLQRTIHTPGQAVDHLFPKPKSKVSQSNPVKVWRAKNKQ